jgi:hypothetical protein
MLLFPPFSGDAGHKTFTKAVDANSSKWWTQQPVVKAGYLEKQSSGMVKKWQSRYFELSGHGIKYYENKETKSDETLKGVLGLQEISGVAAQGAQIIITMNDGKKLNLKSRSDQVAGVWVAEIQQLVPDLEAAAQAKEQGEAVNTPELYSEHAGAAPVAQQMVKNPIESKERTQHKERAHQPTHLVASD